MSGFPTPIERLRDELALSPVEAWAALLAGYELDQLMATGEVLRLDATTRYAASIGAPPRDWAAFEARAATLGLDGQAAFEHALTGMALHEARASGHVLVYHGDPHHPDLAYWEGRRADGRVSGTGPSLLGVIDLLDDTEDRGAW